MILLFVVLNGNYGFSQTSYIHATDMDVNGIFIGGTYTKSQIEEKWGIPTEYRSNESEFGLDEQYYYANDLFRFSDNGVFHSFYINTSKFTVYTAFKGGIKIGDKISKIRKIGLGTPILRDGIYYLNRNNSDDALVLEHSKGIITKIYFITSI